MTVLIAVVLAALLSAPTHLGLADRGSSLAEILAVRIFSGETLVLYRRLEQFGLILIVALVFLVPQVQVLLAAAIFVLVELIARPFGVWADVEPLVRTTPFG